MSYPWRVEIVEVGPRDGLQNEPSRLAVDDRVALIDQLQDAGITHIEVGSFVSARAVPQMAGTAEVFAGLTRRPGSTYAALVPNERGLEAALALRPATTDPSGRIAAAPDEIAIFAAASETFSQRNLNASIDESFARFAPVAAGARGAGLRLRGYVSCVLGCPFEGRVPARRVVEIAVRLAELGCEEVSLGDTIGIGTPLAARALVQAVAGEIGAARVALHFHDSYGQALANVLACLDTGVTTVDAAVGGLGGCPFAPGAGGNLATEDLVHMLAGMGIVTEIDLDALVGTAWWISDRLGRPPASKVARARGRPQREDVP